MLLSGVFSVSVNAETLDNESYHLYSVSYLVLGNAYRNYGALSYTPGDGVVDTFEQQLTFTQGEYNSVGSVNNVVFHYLANDNGTALLEGGLKSTVKLENVYNSFLAYCSQCGMVGYMRSVYSVLAEVTYTDNSVENLGADYVCNDIDLDITFNFTPSKDVQKIMFRVYSSIDIDSHASHMSTFALKSYLGEYDGDDKYNLTIKQPSEEAGLLSGILGALTSGFSGLMDKLTDVFNSIAELPSKIWEFIENGLKSLFVPDEQYIVDMRSRWETMFEEKYGAVWQVVDITFESWDNINANDLKNSIDVPEVSIPLPDGESFSFGGENVKVVPDGFEAITVICKTVTGAFCTLMFINGLRKRYDEVMAVEQ